MESPIADRVTAPAEEESTSDSDMPDEVNTLSFSCWQKMLIFAVAISFIAIAGAGALGKIALSVEFTTLLILSVLIFSLPWLLPAVPKYVKYVDSFRVGDLFEVKLYSPEEQQSLIEKLSQRVAALEDGYEDIAPAPDSFVELTERFEREADEFRRGTKEERIRAVSQMSYIGSMLASTDRGRQYLKTKLETGTAGEKAGAAAAFGALDKAPELDKLLNALRDNSSFVRYQAARAIKNLAPVLDSHQTNQALAELKRASKDSNAVVRRMVGQAVAALD